MFKKEEIFRMWPGKKTGIVCNYCQDTVLELVPDPSASSRYLQQCPKCKKLRNE